MYTLKSNDWAELRPEEDKEVSQHKKASQISARVMKVVGKSVMYVSCFLLLLFGVAITVAVFDDTSVMDVPIEEHVLHDVIVIENNYRPGYVYLNDGNGQAYHVKGGQFTIGQEFDEITLYYWGNEMHLYHRDRW